jgi:benzoyl-CoA reductase/2-hydroxyglutaryl-CoA dehydratase subunit BcrC/BadD/HgdB
MPQRDDHVAHFKDNIDDLIAKLEKVTGNSPENLEASIVLYNRIRSALNQLSVMRKAPNPPITTKEFIKLNHASLIGDPEFIADTLESLVDQLKDKEGKATGPRLMIVGPCMAQGDNKVLDLVEDLGARIVIEEVAEGMRYYRRDIKTDGDLMTNLAEGYLRDRDPWPFVIDVTAQRSERIFETAKEFGAQGIIWYQLKYCECYDFESHYNTGEAEKRGVPFIKLSSEYEQIDKGTLRTRIEAFLETISN